MQTEFLQSEYFHVVECIGGQKSAILTERAFRMAETLWILYLGSALSNTLYVTLD